MPATGWIVTLVLTALIGFLVGPGPVAETLDRRPDARGLELLDYLCSSDAGEQQMTLFGNGTVRLRSRAEPDENWTMSLVELAPDELRAYQNRLADMPYDRESSSPTGGPSGEWVEQCLLTIDKGREGERRYRFARIESLSLRLAYIVDIADELVLEVRGRGRGSGFPAGYRPRRGDVLIRADGSRFRIERFTADGGGVEIIGLDSPLVLYIEAASVVGEFVGLDEKAGRP